ncbi:DgyrCDS14059 [Dimorphilus gyrociliatus]|uniref:DgyrCDS14059 n=1 Tax=Dimorphilus gyrociliatus TaxID=2664684 RepID=A0A7I8WCK4_9ANNE|nr:DgyrCDS14059 [Dimorphilus gyrociliatus]
MSSLDTTEVRGEMRRVSFSDHTIDIRDSLNKKESNSTTQSDEQASAMEDIEIDESPRRSVRDRTPTPPILHESKLSKEKPPPFTVQNGDIISSIKLGSAKNQQAQQNGFIQEQLPSSINYDSSMEIANIVMGTDEPVVDVADVVDVETSTESEEHKPTTTLEIGKKPTENANQQRPILKEINFNPDIVVNNSTVITSGLDFDKKKKRVIKKSSNPLPKTTKIEDEGFSSNHSTPIGTLEREKKVTSYNQVNAVQREIANDKKILKELKLIDDKKKPWYKSSLIYIVIGSILLLLAIIGVIILAVAYVQSKTIDWNEDKGEIISKYKLDNVKNQFLNNVLVSPNSFPNSNYYLFEAGSKMFWFKINDAEGLTLTWNRGREVKIHSISPSNYSTQILGDFLREDGSKEAIYSIHLSSNRWHAAEYWSTDGFSFVAVRRHSGSSQAFSVPSSSDTDKFPKAFEDITKKFTKS